MSLKGVFLVCILWLAGLPAVWADVPSPVIVQTLPAPIIARASGAQTLDLSSYIQNPNVPGTAVRMFCQLGNLSSGNIDLALTDSQTPLTVANFLTYLEGGAYTNTIIHRSIPGFVIQGGEYYFTSLTQISFTPVLPNSVQNEPGISNVAGTIAMAKVGGDPNSATNQWFINLVDNSSNLDNQDGGFTVFGHILGNGLSVANAIAKVPTYDGSSIGPDWTNIPLAFIPIDNSNGFIMSAFVTVSMAVVPAVTYTATSGNTSLLTVSVSGNTLSVTPSTTNVGATNITITATDLEGSQLQTSFNISVLNTYDLWAAAINFANTTDSADTADPANDGVTNLAKYAFGGDPLHAQAIVGLPKAESGGGVTFYNKQFSALAYGVFESSDLVNWTLVWQSSDGFSNPTVTNYTPNVAAGFDALTIRDPSGGFMPVRFWQVKVQSTL